VIEIETLSPSALKLTMPHKIQAGDFAAVASKVDSMIAGADQVRVLIDASGFDGWEDVAAFETHLAFVRKHVRHIARIAIVVGHDWQRGVVSLVGAFVHPEVRAFEKGELAAATAWLTS
jgi:hypothetical protein